jgi:hypothetical protein
MVCRLGRDCSEWAAFSLRQLTVSCGVVLKYPVRCALSTSAGGDGSWGAADSAAFHEEAAAAPATEVRYSLMMRRARH